MHSVAAANADAVDLTAIATFDSRRLYVAAAVLMIMIARRRGARHMAWCHPDMMLCRWCINQWRSQEFGRIRGCVRSLFLIHGADFLCRPTCLNNSEIRHKIVYFRVGGAYTTKGTRFLFNLSHFLTILNPDRQHGETSRLF